MTNNEVEVTAHADSAPVEEQPRLGEALVAAGAISRQQLDQALEVQSREIRKRRLGEILVDGGILSESALTGALSGQLRVPYIDLPTMAIPHEVIALVPRTLAERHQVIPVDVGSDGAIVLAMADPTDVVARDDIGVYSGRRVRPACARPSHLKGAVARYYRFSEQRTEAAPPPRSWSATDFAEYMGRQKDDDRSDPASDDRDTDDPPLKLINELLNPLIIPEPAGGATHSPVDVVDVIFADAVRTRASDVHVEPRAGGVDVRFRVDGLMQEVLSMPKHLQAPLISRIKVMASLDIAERRRPQDGRITLDIDGRVIDARISSMPTVHGEKVVIRLLDADTGLVPIEELGFSARDRDVVEAAVGRPQGLILVTGPTGSGKTSTLYALLRRIMRADNNIVTIEDPVEYQLPGINQVQVDERTGMTFPRALRSVLRQDPDVVMVGEIRDHDTAEIAFQAALTGHLVFSTLHTNDAPSAVTRLVDMRVEPFLIASSLSLVIAQRLVRKVCSHCAAPADAGKKLLGTLGISDEDASRLRAGGGCGECRYTGYVGRLGVYQVMPINDVVREQIVTQVSERTIGHVAEAQGVHSLLEAGVALALDGVTTAEEVLRCAQTHDERRPTCPMCSRDVETGFVVCPWCHHDLAGLLCRSCGKELQSEWRICPYCTNPVEAQSEVSAGAGGGENSRNGAIRPRRVLIVEDDWDVSGAVEAMLTSEGYTVVVAPDGEDALRQAIRFRPDLVLLDVMLPDKSGIEICRELRRLPQASHVPVIFLTGRADSATELAGFEAGGDDYLVKPVDRERLLARIATRIRTSTLA